MRILRRALLVLITPLLTILLFATAFDWGAVKTIGQPNTVKQLLNESGIYKTIIPSLLSQAEQSNNNSGIPLSDPQVISAANQAFPPQLVQQNTNAAIDNIYDWLNGKVGQPTFRLNFADAKANLANQLAAQAQQKATSLPRCTTPFTATSFDIYNATCLPPGITPPLIAAGVKNDVINNQDFFSNPIITAVDVKGNDSNQSIFASQLQNLPSRYQWLKRTPWILVGLTLITVAIIFLLSPSRRLALRHIGTTLVLVGILMLFFAWAVNKEITTKIAPKINISNTAIQSSIRPLVADLSRRIEENYFAFGGLYAILGAVAIASAIFIRRGRVPAAAPAVDTNDPMPPKATSQPAPVRHAQPQTRRIKVQ